MQLLRKRGAAAGRPTSCAGRPDAWHDAGP
jgi:hypothetical protein